MRLVGQDCAARVTDGGPQVPAGPTYGSAISVKAQAKSIKVSHKVNTVSTRGLGDGRDRKRALYGEDSVTVEMMVEDTGEIVLTNGGFIKFEYKLNSTDSAYKVLEGLLVGNDLDIPDGPTMQTLTIECDADGI